MDKRYFSIFLSLSLFELNTRATIDLALLCQRLVPKRAVCVNAPVEDRIRQLALSFLVTPTLFCFSFLVASSSETQCVERRQNTKDDEITNNQTSLRYLL